MGGGGGMGGGPPRGPPPAASGPPGYGMPPPGYGVPPWPAPPFYGHMPPQQPVSVAVLAHTPAFPVLTVAQLLLARLTHDFHAAQYDASKCCDGKRISPSTSHWVGTRHAPVQNRLENIWLQMYGMPPPGYGAPPPGYAPVPSPYGQPPGYGYGAPAAPAYPGYAAAPQQPTYQQQHPGMLFALLRRAAGLAHSKTSPAVSVHLAWQSSPGASAVTPMRGAGHEC